MTATGLWDAARALAEKIRVAAPTATAEELAYLGSAMEKIGGPVSLVDLADHVHTLKTELESFVSTSKSELASSLIDSLAEAELQLKTTTLTEIATIRNNSVSLIEATSSANISLFTTALQELQAAIAAAQSTSQTLSNSSFDHTEAFFFSSL